MKTLRLLPLALAGLCLLPAQAQVYQWKDASGRTMISDMPPAGQPKVQKLAPGTSAGATTPPAKTLAERDMDFKKRQQENREKSEKESKEQAAAAERKDNCERSRRYLATLESGRRISSTNGKGETEFMSDEQRTRETETARKNIADFCR